MILMNRLFRALIPALLALSGAICLSSCRASPETRESSSPPHVISPISPIPTSSDDFFTSEAATASSESQALKDETPPIPISPVVSSDYEPIPVYTYTIVNTYPHDRNAYTQGLIFEEGILYEGTGRWGRSTLRKVELETGNVLQLYSLPDQFFGEGVTVFGDEIFQLTWKSRLGFVYDKESFELLREFKYPTEGWGITHDGERLIMSDGTSTLHFLEPETLEEIGQIDVHDHHGPVVWLNELEYIRGEIYANVWQTDRIARIDPGTGQVTGWIELAGLLGPEDRSQPVDVLNGIAYDPEHDRLFVTGKLWPKLFEIELNPR